MKICVQIFLTNHDKPGGESCVPEVSETAVINVCLHLQVEQEALVDDVWDPTVTPTPEKVTLQQGKKWIILKFLIKQCKTLVSPQKCGFSAFNSQKEFCA